MKKCYLMVCLTGCLLILASQPSFGQAASQYPVADKVADKIIQKYKTSSCEQLQEEKQQPRSAQKDAMEQKAVQVLHNDPRMRQHFLNKIAPTIMNKMFECGFIP